MFMKKAQEGMKFQRTLRAPIPSATSDWWNSWLGIRGKATAIFCCCSWEEHGIGNCSVSPKARFWCLSTDNSFVNTGFSPTSRSSNLLCSIPTTCNFGKQISMQKLTGIIQVTLHDLDHAMPAIFLSFTSETAVPPPWHVWSCTHLNRAVWRGPRQSLCLTVINAFKSPTH